MTPEQYQSRPFVAYVRTHYSSGANRHDTESQAWRDALRIMQSPVLVGNFPSDSRAEISGPGLKVRLSPFALVFWF